MENTKKPPQWKFLRIFVFAAFASIIFALGAYFGPQTVTYWHMRGIIFRPLDAPPKGWRTAPRPLADSAVSADEGTTLSYFGYVFEVPWIGIDQVSDKGRAVEVLFKLGQTVKLFNPAGPDRNPISDDYHTDRDDFKLAFGAGVNQSKYEQFKAVISAVPSQLSPFCLHKEFARTRTLLEIKGLWFEHNDAVPDILSFETKDYRGFEFVGRSNGKESVTLDLFDRSDSHWLILTISRSGQLTQPEINRVIRSFRADPSPK